ncbi:VanZ family protein [Kiritimatiellota bacterium B12222]|nr:VanZ family protein [Kiritimatiellota bacterium B12222]
MATARMKITIPDVCFPFLILLAVFLASGQSQIASPGFSFRMDKIAHFAVFGALATSVIRLPRLRESKWKGALLVCVMVGIYGALDEFRQSFTPGRMVELDDWFADLLGAGVAVVLYQGWPFYRRVLERSPLDGFRRKPIEASEPLS